MSGSTNVTSRCAAWCRRTINYFFGQSWVRFGIVGVASTVTYFVIALGLERLGMPVFVGNTIAYVVGFFVSYFGHKCWSFKSSASHRSALPKFLTTWAIGLGLNTLIIAVLMKFWNVPYIFAMPVAIVVVPFFVYVISRFWAFREPSATVKSKKACKIMDNGPS